MKILSIGNSFSQDAQRYLHKIARKDGVDIKTVNLYVPGCSLRMHYLNMLENAANYIVEINGEHSGIKTSLSSALMSDDWDVVTLQQASLFSANYETYTPYLETLANYVKKYCPKAKIFLHQTWAYEDGSEMLKNSVGYDSSENMFKDIRVSYAKAMETIGADGIIPCGQTMLNAVQKGIGKIHRDTFHSSLGAGRYLLALTWYKTLLKKDITYNDFDDFDIPVSEEERKIIIHSVNEAIA